MRPGLLWYQEQVWPLGTDLPLEPSQVAQRRTQLRLRRVRQPTPHVRPRRRRQLIQTLVCAELVRWLKAQVDVA